MHSPLSHSSILQSPSKALPQPAEAEGISYKYHRYDEFSSSLQSQLDSPTLLPPKSPLMCRLLLSKGKNKAAQLSPHTVTLIKDNEEKTIENAIKCIEIQSIRTLVRNPKAMLLSAIKEQWHPDKYKIKQ